MKPEEMKTWLGLGAALLAAGMWLGALQARVSELERKSTFLHGDFIAPTKGP